MTSRPVLAPALFAAFALVAAVANAAAASPPDAQQLNRAAPAEVVIQAARAQGGDNSNAMSFTADGSLMALGGSEVRLYEPQSGLLVRRFSLATTDGHRSVVARQLALSQDGKLLAAVATNPVGDDHKLDEVRVWDTATGKLIKRLHFDVADLRFAPDGRLSVLLPKFEEGTGKELHAPALYDVRTGKKSAAPGLLINERRLHDEPSGRVWVEGSAEDGQSPLTLVDPKSKQRLQTIKVGRFARVAFNPSFTRLVTGKDEQADLELRDASTGAALRTLAMPAGYLRAVSFAADGAEVVAAAVPRTVRADGVIDFPDEFLFFWSAETGELLRKLPLPKNAHSDASALVAGGRVLVANTQQQLRFFDTSTGLQIAGEAVSTRNIKSLSWSADGARLLAGEGSGSDGQGRVTQVWDLSTGRLSRRLDALHAAFAPGDASAVVFQEYETFLADPRTFAKSKAVPIGYPIDGAFSGDGKLLALEAKDQVHVLDAVTLQSKGVVAGGAPAFSADGAVLATLTNKPRVVHVYDGRTLQPLRECGDRLEYPADAVAISPDGKLLAMGGAKRWLRDAEGTLDLYDATTCKLLHKLPVGFASVEGIAFSPDGKRLAAASVRTHLFDVRSGREVASLQLAEPGTSVAFRPGRDGELAVATRGGEIALWKTAEPQPYARLIGLGNDYVTLLADNRYAASRGALRNLAFRVGTRALPFEQFDLRFNRPDAVIEKLGAATPAKLEAARTTVRKRLKRAGLTEASLEGALELPEVSLAAPPPPSTKERELAISVRASSPAAPLSRLLVTVNDVPMAGNPALDLKGGREAAAKVAVRLSAGRNRVQIAAVDNRGVESLRRTFEIDYQAPPKKPDLYAVVVGVSAYRDADRSLRYAAKDASDVAAFFEKRADRFGQIKVLRLLDGEAVKEKIAAARQLLANSTEDDEAVVFFAGHGLRDEKLDYYFATADIDFEHPAARGLPYEELEGLLDGIGARRKLLLIDTCNSGDLDKDDATLAAASDTKTAEGVVKSRGIKAVKTRTAPALGVEGAAELLEDVFADLRRGSGAVAIASAGGAEFALESDAWKNGVFTYALLSTMTAGKSRVSEVRNEVTAKVTALTEGKQRPTVRRENLSNDFEIY